MTDRQSNLVWPPAPPADTEPVLPTTSVRSPVASKRLSGTWHAIESAWLGTASVALGLRGNWSPEPIESACPRCGRSVGAGEVSPDDGRCTGCRPEKLAWERLIRLGEFDGDLRKAVLETKYGRWRKQGTLLGRMLGDRIAQGLSDASINPESAVLIPAPMPWLRRMRRGIDHALVIARGAAETSGCRVEAVLHRRRGMTQTNVPASARATNIRGQIAAIRSPAAEAEVFVLIDDVRTTGATLDACCRALTPDRKSPPRIWAGVACVTVERGRRASGSA